MAVIRKGHPVLAIGNLVVGVTAGSLMYADGDLRLAQNNSKLYWDYTNDRLGVGTNKPDTTLEVAGHITFQKGKKFYMDG